MEEGIDIKQRLIELYTELQNPSLFNANEVSNSIIEIYSSISSIPILIDIMMNSDNQNFRQQASFGLKYSLSSCSSQLDPSKCDGIWNSLFALISNETDEHSVDILLSPLIELFQISNYEWSLVEGFVNSLGQTNLLKCFHVVSSLLPYVQPEYVSSHFDYFSTIIEYSFTSPKKMELFKYTFIIFFNLAFHVRFIDPEIYKNFIQKVTRPFSEMLIVLFTNEEYLKESISDIIGSIDYQINPFSLEKLFQAIIESLKNSTFSMEMKSNIILLFGQILEYDASFIIDVATLQNLISMSISLSIEIFNHSEDFYSCDSFIFSQFFYQCLNRIPNENLRAVTDPFIESLSNAQTLSELYNLLLLFEACLQRSSLLFVDEYSKIVTVLINCLQSNHPGIRNEAACIFYSQKVLIQSIEKVRICQIIQLIINILSSQDFFYGYTIIDKLIDELDDSDPIFESTFSICNQIIRNFSEIDSSLITICWSVLNNLLKKSKQLVLNVFDDLYSFCFSLISQFISNDNENSKVIQFFVPSMVKCLSSLSKSCYEKIIEKLNEIFSLFIILLKDFSNDFKIHKSVLKSFKSFVSKMPNEFESYIYSFLTSTFKEDLYQATVKMESDKGNQRNYSVYVIAPSINLLSKILRNYPHFFGDAEMINYLLKVFVMGINSIYTKEIIASLHLFKKTLIFMNKSNIILPNVVRQYVMYIISKMEKETDGSVIRSMFDALNKAISIFGNSIIFQSEASLFQFVIKCVEGNKNKFTNEIEYNHIYNEKALQLLGNIIKNFYDNNDDVGENNNFNDLLIRDFIPRILQILNEQDPLFVAFGLNLMSQIAISAKSILSPEILSIPIQKSLFFIEQKNGLTVPSIVFLDSLINNHQISEDMARQLICLAEAQISSLDCSIADQKCLSEYFITLLTILDLHANNLIDDQKKKIILSNLPIVFSKLFNNKYIYLFLLKHFNDSQDLQFDIMKNIVIVFESASTIVDSYLPQEIISNLLAIILQSGIINDLNALNALFKEQNDRIQNFTRTISFLSQQNTEKD